MKTQRKRFAWIYDYFGSKKLTIGLLGMLCVLLAVTTFMEEQVPVLWTIIRILLMFMAGNLAVCTLEKIRVISKTILVVHTGLILTMAGGLISSFGYVATVNIYEGTSVDKAYRWDKEKDVPLGVDLMVKKINVEYYPIPLKVGVLRGEEKVGLFELKTGESFRLERYTVKAESMEFPSENLRLSVFNEDHYIGSVETEGTDNLPADFPFDFRLVAYKDPSLFRMWVDLELLKGSDIVAEGTSEVNGPLTWEKIKFHFTKADVDQFGNSFAGMQITYDPGLPYVYAGFVIISIGCLMYLRRRLNGRR